MWALFWGTGDAMANKTELRVFALKEFSSKKGRQTNIVKPIVNRIFFGVECHSGNEIGKCELRTKCLKGTSP